MRSCARAGRPSPGAIGMGVEVLEVVESIAHEVHDVVPVMVVRHRPAERWEEAFRRIGLRVVRRGRDQAEPIPVPPQGLPDDLRPLGVWIRALSSKTIAVRPRPWERSTRWSSW
jgi:hypothetical protein